MMEITKEEEEKRKKWMELYDTGVWDIEEDIEEVLTDGQELFIALLEGDDKDIEERLYHYVYGNEYNWTTDGGEPDLGDVLAIKLLEKIKGEKYYASIIYQDDYLEHIGIKEKEEKEEKERKRKGKGKEKERKRKGKGKVNINTHKGKYV